MKAMRWQHGWRFQIGRFGMSCFRRSRSGRVHRELHRGTSNSFLKFGWASPTVHRWWARTFYLYWRHQ